MEAGMEPQAAVAAGEASAAVEDMGRAEEATEGEEARSEGAEDEALLLRTQRLISKINASQENPNPRDLHALASILETQESRYVKESGSSNVARSSHAIGKLSNLVRENDEFYELISSRFLSESRYSISIRAASARILLSCPSTGMYPHVFDATVLDNFKTWVMEDSIEPSAVACNWKHELGRSKPTDFEMLKTYATGLLAMSLAGGAKVVEDILTSGLSAKLMRYLRMQILGEASSSQKDISSQAEARHHAGPTSARGREENKGRPRQVLDGLRLVDECLPVDQNGERDRDKITGVRQAREVECRGDVGELLKSELSASSTDVNIYELIDGEGDGVDDNGWDNRDLLDGKSRFGERQVARSAHEDVDESVRDDSARRRTNRGWPRPRGKGRIPEGTLESERPLLSPLFWPKIR
ncbi:hypothetical protein HPP92_024782 [Vanilla planifolia]|uniref:Uncharacterized protein n=1 Tax=Vanilla planifolia TaxID=51239 RepID=A0A835PIU7_VANPL|nr:hypothetical protein HPP92_024782 [Vanilla planifolia]